MGAMDWGVPLLGETPRYSGILKLGLAFVKWTPKNVAVCLSQTFHIFFMCAPRGFLSGMIYCNKLFLFMPVQVALGIASVRGSP